MNRHEKLIEQYCQDWLETERPWERWQVKFKNSDGWVTCGDHPIFSEKYEYRRKPRTILINGIEVPEPEREPLKFGERYCIPHLYVSSKIGEFYWAGDDLDLRCLNRGVVHLTKESATKHAEALISFTKQP